MEAILSLGEVRKLRGRGEMSCRDHGGRHPYVCFWDPSGLCQSLRPRGWDLPSAMDAPQAGDCNVLPSSSLVRGFALCFPLGTLEIPRVEGGRPLLKVKV